jgi:hypothetical protein
MTNHSESDDEIFALEEKHNTNKNQNIIIKQPLTLSRWGTEKSVPQTKTLLVKP